MIQRFLELDESTIVDVLFAGARTARKTGLAVVVVVARDPGVVAQARRAAEEIGHLDVETTITAATIRACFRPSPSPSCRQKQPPLGWLSDFFLSITGGRKRNRV
jgi:hypothetical protein